VRGYTRDGVIVIPTMIISELTRNWLTIQVYDLRLRPENTYFMYSNHL